LERCPDSGASIRWRALLRWTSQTLVGEALLEVVDAGPVGLAARYLPAHLDCCADRVRPDRRVVVEKSSSLTPGNLHPLRLQPHRPPRRRGLPGVWGTKTGECRAVGGFGRITARSRRKPAAASPEREIVGPSAFGRSCVRNNSAPVGNNSACVRDNSAPVGSTRTRVGDNSAPVSDLSACVRSRLACVRNNSAAIGH
jgi:hypothetical protein